MTYDEIKTEYDRIPIVRPFGFKDSGMTLPGDNQFGESYGIPPSRGGRRISRHQFNGLGYLATIGTCLDSYGYQYEWRDLSSVGGYPKGAIVSKIDESGVKKYVSLIDDNTNEPQLEDVLDDESGESNGWKPLFSTTEYNFFPDYESKELIWEYHILPSATLGFSSIQVEEQGWILVERKIDNWDEVVESTANQALRNSWYGAYNYVDFVPFIAQESDPPEGSMRINLTEGPTVTRFYPCNNGFSIKGSCSDPVSGITVSVYHLGIKS